MGEVDAIANNEDGALAGYPEDSDYESEGVEKVGERGGDEEEPVVSQGPIEDGNRVAGGDGPAGGACNPDDDRRAGRYDEDATEVQNLEEGVEKDRYDEGEMDRGDLDQEEHQDKKEQDQREEADEGGVVGKPSRAKGGAAPRKPVRHSLQRSAYFVFSSKHRDEIKAELAAAGLPTAVTAVAKALGARWHTLSAEEKEAYKPAPVAEEDEAGPEEGHADVDQDQDQEQEQEQEQELQVTVFPKLKIKRIAAQDKGVRSISGDATLLLARATELFLESLAESSYVVLKTSNRLTIKVDDLERAISRKRPFRVFLSDNLNDIWKHKDESAPSADAEPKAAAAKNQPATARDAGKGSRPITSFFQRLS